MNAIRHGRELGQPRVRRHRLSIAGGGSPLPPPSLDQQVAAILAGTKGFAIDPRDFSTLFQDAAGAIPVTAAGQSVARINTKWGLAPQNWTQSSGAAIPILDAKGIRFDGVDDFFNSFSDETLLQLAPGAFHCCRANITRSGCSLMAFSTTTSATARFNALVDEAGIMAVAYTVGIASGVVTHAPAGAIVPLNQDVTLSALADAIGGKLETWINGVSTGTPTVRTGANFSDTIAVAERIGRRVSSTAAFVSGVIGRQVLLPRAPTPEERATIEAWVGEAA